MIGNRTRGFFKFVEIEQFTDVVRLDLTIKKNFNHLIVAICVNAGTDPVQWSMKGGGGFTKYLTYFTTIFSLIFGIIN